MTEESHRIRCIAPVAGCHRALNPLRNRKTGTYLLLGSFLVVKVNYFSYPRRLTVDIDIITSDADAGVYHRPTVLPKRSGGGYDHTGLSYHGIDRRRIR